ncbi:MAG: hypothetical protein FD167_5387, partial [bacterium]
MNNSNTTESKQRQAANKEFEQNSIKMLLKCSISSVLGMGVTVLHHKLTGGIFARVDSIMFTSFLFVFVLT